MSVFVRARKDGCTSDLVLDRLLAGDVTEPEAARVRAHLGECADCAARLAELEGERSGYRATPPILLHPARRPRRWIAVAGGLVVAAALALFALRPPGEATRTKGGGRLGFFVKRGDDVWRGAAGEHLRPGDALRFTATLPERRYVAVLSLDAAKRATIYYPLGDTAAAVEPGAEALMPMATLLDGALGPERLFGIFCTTPIALEPLRDALARTGALAAPPGCELDVLAVDKRAGR